MGFGGLSTPSKGSILGRFWALLTIFEEPPGRGPPFERLLYGCFGPEALKTAKKRPFFVGFWRFFDPATERRGLWGRSYEKTSYFETP